MTKDNLLMTWDNSVLFEQIESAYRLAKLSSQWSAERDAVRDAILAISQRLPHSRYAPAGVLGVGGSSIVIRVTDSLFPGYDNALKFPRPTVGDPAIVASMMAGELRNLAELRHQGLARMLYYRTIDDIDPFGKLPFCLMEAVDGVDSKRYFSDAAVTESSFLSIASALAKTLLYLHDHPKGPYVHLDIKPQNIMIQRGGVPVLLDLGTCKQLSSGRDQTVVAVTPNFADPRLIRLLGDQKSEQHTTTEFQMKLKRSELEPSFDVWSFGLVILDWMGVNFTNGLIRSHAIVERLSAYSRKFLYFLLARIFASDLPKWLIDKVGVPEGFIKENRIHSSQDLVEQLSRLTGHSSPLAKLPELGKALTGSIQAAPGVHVPNTDRLARTLGLALFRRLNSVTQLGIVSQVFPSAKHTRREHSLGTYGNVCRMLWALYDDNNSPLFRQVIDETDLKVILVCALFHDLGQFPLAHDFEDVAPEVFNHEDLTEGMIKGLWRTGRAGSRVIRFGKDLEKVLELWGTTSARVLAVLNARPRSAVASSKDKLLRSIISGPIDADKLDYLFRDSRNTDVPYPNGIDVERLLRCLTVVFVTPRSGDRFTACLGVYAKGKVAAEFLTLSRYAMFTQVYWHHAVRAQKAMLSRAVGALLSSMSQVETEGLRASFYQFACGLPDSLFSRTSRSTQLAFDENGIGAPGDPVASDVGEPTDLFVTDAAVLNWIRARLRERKLPEEVLIKGIVERNLYKRLWAMPRDLHHEEEWDSLCKVWEDLKPKQRNSVARQIEVEVEKLLRDSSSAAKDVTLLSAKDALALMSQMTASKEPWLLVDLPAAKSGSEVGLHFVTESQARRMRKDDRAVADIQLSAAWTRYADEIHKTAGNIRVYCDYRLVDTIDASLTVQKGLEIIRDVAEAERKRAS